MIPAGPQLQALDRSVPHRTRTATSGSKRSPLDLVFLAGPEQQAQDAGPQPQGPDQSVPRQTCTKNLRRYTRLPDARKNVWRYASYICQKECRKISGCFCAKKQCQTESQNRCQKECQNKCQIEYENECQIECQRKCQLWCQKGCQIGCQNWCQIGCQNRMSEKNVR